MERMAIGERLEESPGEPLGEPPGSERADQPWASSLGHLRLPGSLQAKALKMAFGEWPPS